MRGRLFIALSLVIFLFVGCDKKEADIDAGKLYYVTTTEGDGFVVFKRMPDNSWGGVYYLSRGQLMAERHKVKLKVGKELTLVDEKKKEIPIRTISPYKEPEFKEYPETWAYLDSTYSVTVKKDEVYGKAQGYWVSYPDTGGSPLEIFNAKRGDLSRGKSVLDLTMDVYLPNDNKVASRPLLVLIHGGAFFNGDKSDLGFPVWAHDFASRGYVVASVNYRLGFNKNKGSVKRAGIRGVQDVDAAIRYIVHHKDAYGVDPDRVFVAGTSAGGITALNVAFMRDEDIPSEAQEVGGIKSVNPEMTDTYSIRAVGNMWGAVNDLSILDHSSLSVISFHSTGDPVVPYGKGHPFKKIFLLNELLFPEMYGSEKITEYICNHRSNLMSEQKTSLRSYDLPGRHTLHVDKNEAGERVLNARFYEIDTAMCAFFSSVMNPSPIKPKHIDNLQVFQIESTELDSVYWRVQGGCILEHDKNSAKVLLFPDASSHSVTVCGKYKSGLTFRKEWKIRFRKKVLVQ